MTTNLANRTILLGITGSIAAYKVCDLASKLTQAGARVTTLLTASAQQFITPLTLQALTGQPVYAERKDGTLTIPHVTLGESADGYLIAPCTANTLAKLAHGIADNWVTLTALSARCPIWIAPAMDGGMWQHPATQANIVTLRGFGLEIWDPAEGRMASGLQGVGRMMEPAMLLGNIRAAIGKRYGSLAGKKVVITAGGTQESIDPVRFLSNHSSGKQGFAIAQAAVDAGAAVTLITTPPTRALPSPVGATVIPVTSAREMESAVLQHIASADALFMAAAVADFRPTEMADQKIKRQGRAELTLALTANPDILQSVAEHKQRTGFPRVTIGFAAETDDLLAHAAEKLQRKRVDLLVANDVRATDAGFGVDTNRVVLLAPNQPAEHVPLQSKDSVAIALCQWLSERLRDD